MEEERRIFRQFLQMHAAKATPTDEPMAHLQFYSPRSPLPADAPLIRLDYDDVLDALDADGSELVRWLLEQMKTYDCRRQRIVGLVFLDGTAAKQRVVLSEVLRCAPSEVPPAANDGA